MSKEYFDAPRIVFDCGEGGQAQFVRICITCGRFVEPYTRIYVSASKGLADSPNAYCVQCGATQMLFEGFF